MAAARYVPMLEFLKNHSLSKSPANPSPTIYLALTDDWELRGNGSGDMAQIQFAPMGELLRIFEKYNARTTFNVEVMQQLTFRKLQGEHSELGRLADAWDEHVRAAYSRGHDIQLHIHPQWSKAEYEAGTWKLHGDWSLPNYDQDTAYSMLAESKAYIENLLRPLDASYRCVSFRSGSSSVAPSEFALTLLVKLGIVFDMSIIGGYRVNTRNLQVDYTNCEESLLPFYPRMNDARKVSHKPEAIVCVPIFSFTLSRRQAFKQILSNATSKIARKFSPGIIPNGRQTDYVGQEWAEIAQSSFLARGYHKAIKPSLRGKHITADIGEMDYIALKEMVRAIRVRAHASGLPELPIILTNHSKNISDFSHIERFLADVAQAEDMQFATLTDLARRLEAGDFPIKTAGAPGKPA